LEWKRGRGGEIYPGGISRPVGIFGHPNNVDTLEKR
jgi:hypothetical protein